MLSTFTLEDPMSWRDYLQPVSCLTWMTIGGTNIEVDVSGRRRSRFTLDRARPFCLFPAREYTYVSSTAAPRQGIALYFSKEDLSSILSQEDSLPDFNMVRESFADKRLVQLVSSLWYAQQPKSDDFLRKEYLQLAIAHHLLAAEGRLQKHASNGKFSPPMRRLIESMIAEDFGSRLGVISFSHLAGVSASHFHQLFTRTFGTSFHQYVLSKRIDAAQLMLGAKECSIQEIARATGFGSLAHFSSTFKRLTGQTPSSFRR